MAVIGGRRTGEVVAARLERARVDEAVDGRLGGRDEAALGDVTLPEGGLLDAVQPH